jgi:CheY-like chemotaxis protein
MHKILLVEDDEDWQEILQEDITEAVRAIHMLPPLINSVKTFSDASNVLRNDETWNLLITDIKLPPASTYEAGKTNGKILVERAYRLQIPTIVVSAECTDNEVVFFLRVKKIYNFFGKGGYLDRRQEFYQNIQDIMQQRNNWIPKMNYIDFQVIVSANGKIRASSDQGGKSDDFRLEMNDIKLALNVVERRETNGELLKNLGNKLFQALFPTAIRGHLRATMAGAAASERGVRLRLIFEDPELAALPWEFLYDADTNTFLGNDTQTALSHYIDVPLQRREIRAAQPPLKILLVIASPKDLPQLDAAGEERLIREALARHINEGRIELDVLDQATIRNINQKLHEKPYNVLHFIGHGAFENEKGFIALVDEDGKARLLDDENFANFFLGNRNLGLVVLNSCEGAEVSSNQIFAGIAPHLVRRGIPAVVAMQYSILDSTAKLFADEFYRTLALGWPVDAAIQATRNAISIEVGLDKRDFATPVLYMGAKDGVILEGL